MNNDGEQRDREGGGAESAHPYTRLSPDAVIAAVESTGRLSDARILALNSYENRVYQVGLDQAEPVIAKFYRPRRWSPAQIDEEHRFTRYLHEHEIAAVPPLMLDPDGEYPTLAEFDGFLFALYPRQGGRAPELDNLDHLHELGRFIGRLHVAGSDFPFVHRQRLATAAGRDNVEFLLAAEFVPPDLEASYRAVTAAIVDELERTPPDSAGYAQISLHGDCHSGNVLWRDGHPHFVDFDDAITGPAIQDLWMLLSGDIPTRQRQLVEIVDGYETFRGFDLRELRLIEPLRAMRVLHFNAWIARRWDDPAFPLAFPWFNTPRFWSDYILELKELLAELGQPPLEMPKI